VKLLVIPETTLEAAPQRIVHDDARTRTHARTERRDTGASA